MQIKVVFEFPDVTDPTSAAAFHILSTFERDCNRLVYRQYTANDTNYAYIERDDPTDEE